MVPGEFLQCLNLSDCYSIPGGQSLPWEESACSRFVSSAALRAAASTHLHTTQAEDIVETALKSLQTKILTLIQDAVYTDEVGTIGGLISLCSIIYVA